MSDNGLLISWTESGTDVEGVRDAPVTLSWSWMVVGSCPSPEELLELNVVVVVAIIHLTLGILFLCFL